jgi:hypothetical protein
VRGGPIAAAVFVVVGVALIARTIQVGVGGGLGLLLGGLLVLASAGGAINKVLLVIAIAFGTINVVGGFLVTDRMLEMFKGKKPDVQD